MIVSAHTCTSKLMLRQNDIPTVLPATVIGTLCEYIRSIFWLKLTTEQGYKKVRTNRSVCNLSANLMIYWYSSKVNHSGSRSPDDGE